MGGTEKSCKKKRRGRKKGEKTGREGREGDAAGRRRKNAEYVYEKTCCLYSCCCQRYVFFVNHVMLVATLWDGL